MSETGKMILEASGSKPRPKPVGWWSLPGHDYDGSREGVLKAIADVKDVPERWKEMAIAEIGELPAEFNHVTIGAHVSIATSPDGKIVTRTYDFDVVGSKKL